VDGDRETMRREGVVFGEEGERGIGKLVDRSSYAVRGERERAEVAGSDGHWPAPRIVRV